MGNAVGVVQMTLTTAGSVVTNLGTAVETGSAFLLSRALDMRRKAAVKELESVITNLQGRLANTSAQLELYGSDEEDGPFTLIDTIELSEEDPGWTKVDGYRWYKLKYVDDNVSDRWAIHGITIFGDYGGEEWEW